MKPANIRCLVLACCHFAASSASALAAAEDLSLGVRTTPPLTPTEQQAKFKLPPGFEIQLVASEPDIHKPMNLQFDAIGRLWATTSIEYPFPAPTNRVGRDRLMIFEDFGPDGRARKVTQFADGLNIPIGVYPYRTDATHWKAIVWSIPHIWLLEDTDGDGKSDTRTALYGPFDHTRDTHGNQASFRRGFDGWLYATHGYNNDSHVTARDGSHVDLNSGNTYRIRLDGSRIEQHTHGQVNPFGLVWDARGNLYSSDCHTAPIYQLLEGGWYPSFGKPHDGLGYAPVMLEHAHGSTAIDGAFYYNDDLWPAEYQDTFMVGNVMTSRLNRDQITFLGSTPKAMEQPDFLTTTDPWFRPVDTTLGSDGALYLADFYNRIIGHYEVPLLHPGRDRERGRIWRVVYRGADGQAKLRPADLSPDLAGLLGELGSPNLTRRLLAQHDLEDRFGTAAVAKLQGAARGEMVFPDAKAKIHAQVHGLWALLNLNQLDDESLRSGLSTPEPLLRVHQLRMLSEIGRRLAGNLPGTRRPPNPDALRASVVKLLVDPDALVRRCAVETLSVWPAFSNLRPLLDLRAQVPAEDTHLLYVVRKGIRDQLSSSDIFDQVLAKTDWSESDRRALTDVTVAVQSPQAATFLLRQLSLLPETGSPSLGDALKHAARFAPEGELAKLVGLMRERFADRIEIELALFQSLDQGLQQRGVRPSGVVHEWGEQLVGRLLENAVGSSWANAPVDAAPTENPWDFQTRQRADGKSLRALSSLPRGEDLTGALRSPEFSAGGTLSFWVCGHDGYPERPVQQKNVVRLRDAKTGDVLRETPPPRSDVAVRIVWDTAAWQGRQVYLEVIDADTGDGFAWIALGDLEGGPMLPTVSPRAVAERVAGAAELAARLGLQDVAPRLLELARQPGDPDARAAAGKGLASLNPAGAIAALGPQVADGGQPLVVRERFGLTLIELNSAAARVPVLAAMKDLPYRVQQRWAAPLCASRDGADAFLAAVERGDASPRILQLASARGRLQRANPPNWLARFEKLTQDLQPMDEVRGNLIAARMNGFNAAAANPADGERVFQQHCAVCHQIGGKGGLVGPQLTGIGVRGVERLCEDIFDPNRNVDRAFRQTLLTLRDGEGQSGLFRREEGDLLVFADATGKEFTLRKGDVVERKESDLSLMPENFGEAIPVAQFNQLLAFLLSQRQAN